MLVLSRKAGERIVIGGDVVVTVLGMRGGQLRLGIEAPKSIPIVREEVAEDDLSCLSKIGAGAGGGPLRVASR